jgi:hypothetical protein
MLDINKYAKGRMFSHSFFFVFKMYPQPPRPPTHNRNDEFEEYPLNDTGFIEQRPVMQSPFIEAYPPEERQPRLQPYDSNQPLLQTNPSPPPVMPMPMPYPDNNRYSVTPPISYDGSSPVYYTNAPRRQPRRYKTSKLLVICLYSKQFICFK